MLPLLTLTGKLFVVQVPWPTQVPRKTMPVLLPYMIFKWFNKYQELTHEIRRLHGLRMIDLFILKIISINPNHFLKKIVRWYVVTHQFYKNYLVDLNIEHCFINTYMFKIVKRLLSKRQKSGSIGKDVKRSEPFYTVGTVLVQPLWKTVWRLLRKLKIELPYDPATHFWL